MEAYFDGSNSDNGIIHVTGSNVSATLPEGACTVEIRWALDIGNMESVTHQTNLVGSNGC
jgi:hypothetical protein